MTQHRIHTNAYAFTQLVSSCPACTRGTKAAAQVGGVSAAAGVLR